MAETPFRAQQRNVTVKERRPYPFTVVFLEFLHGYPCEYVVRLRYISRRALAEIEGTSKDVDQEHEPCGPCEFNLVRNLVYPADGIEAGQSYENQELCSNNDFYGRIVYAICGNLINFHKRSDEGVTISEDDCEIGISYGKIDRD